MHSSSNTRHPTPDKTENLERGLAAARSAVAQGAELVCFAELAFELFYPQRPSDGKHLDLAEPIPGPITDAFCALAKELGIVIVPNLFERDSEQTFDTSPLIDANGTLLGATRMPMTGGFEPFY